MGCCGLTKRRDQNTRLDQHEPEVIERHREEEVREVSP
jgi:hypothetical protein